METKASVKFQIGDIIVAYLRPRTIDFVENHYNWYVCSKLEGVPKQAVLIVSDLGIKGSSGRFYDTDKGVMFCSHFRAKRDILAYFQP